MENKEEKIIGLELEIRECWSSWGIPKEVQDDILRELAKKAKPGKLAPWILIDATGDASAVAKANAYLGAATAKRAPAPAAPIDPNNLSPEVMALLGQLGAKPV